MEEAKSSTLPILPPMPPAEPMPTPPEPMPTPPEPMPMPTPPEPMPTPPEPMLTTAEPTPSIDFDAFISAIMTSMSNDGTLNLLKVLKKLGLATSAEYPSNDAFHSAIKPFVNQLLAETKTVLGSEDPMCAGNRTHGLVKIIGDVHGDLSSLILFLSNFVWTDPSSGQVSLGDTTLVFLGDLTDRGKNGLFVCMIIFALKCRFPNQVVLISGNHEDRGVTEMYGFKGEMEGKGMRAEYDFIIDEIFPLFRIFWILGENMFVHGGIPSDKKLAQLVKFGSNGNELQMKLHKNNLVLMSREERLQLDEFQAACYREHWMLIEQVRWADPTLYTQYFKYSSRGCDCVQDFGGQAIYNFLEYPIIADSAEMETSFEPLNVARVFRGHSHGEKYPEYEKGDGGGNVLFGGYLYVVWSVREYGKEVKGSGFMEISTETEDKPICPALKKVDRLSTDTLTYYAAISKLNFEKMDDSFEQMASLPTNGTMILFWELTDVGDSLAPSTGADDNTPFPSRSNSNA
jgi:hypothetical protein